MIKGSDIKAIALGIMIVLVTVTSKSAHEQDGVHAVGMERTQVLVWRG